MHRTPPPHRREIAGWHTFRSGWHSLCAPAKPRCGIPGPLIRDSVMYALLTIAGVLVGQPLCADCNQASIDMGDIMISYWEDVSELTYLVVARYIIFIHSMQTDSRCYRHMF